MANDHQHLARLQDYTRQRILPSYSAIGRLVGLNSKASVAYLVRRLKADGLVGSTPDRRLKPGRRFRHTILSANIFS